MHDLAGQLARRAIGVAQGKHPRFDLLFVVEAAFAARETGKSQGQRQQIQKLTISTLDFARVSAHGYRLRSLPIDLRTARKEAQAAPGGWGSLNVVLLDAPSPPLLLPVF